MPVLLCCGGGSVAPILPRPSGSASLWGDWAKSYQSSRPSCTQRAERLPAPRHPIMNAQTPLLALLRRLEAQQIWRMSYSVMPSQQAAQADASTAQPDPAAGATGSGAAPPLRRAAAGFSQMVHDPPCFVDNYWVENPAVSAQDAVKILVHQIQRNGPISEPADAVNCCTLCVLGALSCGCRCSLLFAFRAATDAFALLFWPAPCFVPLQSSVTCRCCIAVARQPMTWIRP